MKPIFIDGNPSTLAILSTNATASAPYDPSQVPGLLVLSVILVVFAFVGSIYTLWTARKDRGEQTPAGHVMSTMFGSPLLSFHTRAPAAEFIGTFIAQFLVGCMIWNINLMYIFAPGVQNKAAGLDIAPVQTPSPIFSGVTVGILYTLILFMVPGATLNPMMTVHSYYLQPALRTRAGYALLGNIFTAQLMGTLSGNALTYALLITPLTHYMPEPKTIESQTAMLFGVSYPEDWVSNSLAGFAVLVTCAIFVVSLNGILQSTERDATHPLARCASIGLLVTVVVWTLCGVGLGVGMNPVQPLAGAIFVSLAGWPSEIWTHHGGFVWVSIFFPFIGCIIGLFGCLLYDYSMMRGNFIEEHTK